MRRGPLLVASIVVVGLGLAVLAEVLRSGATRRSVLLVTIDTLRADHTGVGGRTPSLTPALDALAADGAAFPDAWTVAPLTVPAHATLLTGLLPPRHGLRTNAPARRLPPAEARPWATLAETASRAGFRTAAFVSSSVLRDETTGLGAGFERFDAVDAAEPGALEERERRGDATVDAAIAWLRGADGAWFLWVHLWDPHGPYDAPAGWGAGPAHRADAEGYAAEVRWTDHCLGRLLEAAGEDAVVCVVADHGEALGEHGEATHGYLLHEATLRVPLVLRARGVIAPGTRVTEPRSVREVAPTLVALAGLEPPEGMPGGTLLDARPRVLYAESLYGNDVHRWAQAFALRVGTWKLVDAGSELREFDLAADPREERPAVLDPAAPGEDARRPEPIGDALETLHDVASATPVAAGEAPAAILGGNYLGGGGEGGAYLRPEENRRLPSPYVRIADAAMLQTGQTLLAGGAAAAALVQFEELGRRSPGDPQAPYWRGRALLALRRPVDAAAAFRGAFDLGMQNVRCVEKALQAAVVAVEGGAAGEERPALAFLDRARGRNVPDSAATALLESTLLAHAGDLARAREALDRARRQPLTEVLARGVREMEQRLDLLARPR